MFILQLAKAQNQRCACFRSILYTSQSRMTHPSIQRPRNILFFIYVESIEALLPSCDSPGLQHMPRCNVNRREVPTFDLQCSAFPLHVCTQPKHAAIPVTCQKMALLIWYDYLRCWLKMCCKEKRRAFLILHLNIVRWFYISNNIYDI